MPDFKDRIYGQKRTLSSNTIKELKNYYNSPKYQEDKEREKLQEEYQKAQEEYRRQEEKRRQALELQKKNATMYMSNNNLIGRIWDGLTQKSQRPLNNLKRDKDGSVYTTEDIDNEDTGNTEYKAGQKVKNEDILKYKDKLADKKQSSGYMFGNFIAKGVESFAEGITDFAVKGIPGLVDMSLSTIMMGNQKIAELVGFEPNEETKKADKRKWLETKLGVKNLINKTGLFEDLGKEDNKELENIYKEERERGEQYGDGIQKSKDAVFGKINEGADSLIESLFGSKESDDIFEELNTMASNTALETSGHKKEKMFDDADLSKLSTKVGKYNNTSGKQLDLQEEIMPEGSDSVLNSKILKKNEKGEVEFDQFGDPVYVNKYSLADKMSRSNLFNYLGDDYNSENLADLAGNAATFLIGGSGAAKVLGAGIKGVEKGTVRATRAIQSLKTVEKATEKISKFAEKSKSLSEFGKDVSKLGEAVKGSKLNNRATRLMAMPVKKALSKEGITTMLNSYVLTDSESRQIGDDTHKTVYNNILNKSAGIDSAQIYEDVQAQNPEKSPEEIELIVAQQKHQKRTAFEDDPENKSIVKEALIAANQGRDFAVASNNSMAFLLNLSSAGLFTKSVSKARNILHNPLGIKNYPKTAMALLREGSQEFVEEGYVNQIAQKAGESFGEKGSFNFNDYWENDLFSTESLESAYLGFFMGTVQTAGTQAAGLKTRVKDYKDQQKQLKELSELGALPPEQIKKLVSHSYDIDEIKAFDAQITRLEKEGRSEEADVLRDKLLINKSVRAATTGTSQILTDTLTEMLKSDEYSAEDKVNIQKSIQLNEMIADIHDKHRGYAGVNRIVENRANKQIFSEHRLAHETGELLQAKEAYNKMIERENRGIAKTMEAQRSEMDSERQKTFDDQYSDIFERNKSTYDYSKTKEAKDLKEHEEIARQMQEHEDSLDIGYNTLLSKKYQSSYKTYVQNLKYKRAIREVEKETAKQKKDELAAIAKEEKEKGSEVIPENVNNEVDKVVDEKEKEQLSQEKPKEDPKPNPATEAPPYVESDHNIEVLEGLFSDAPVTTETPNEVPDIQSEVQTDPVDNTPVDQEEEILDEVDSPLNAPFEVTPDNRDNITPFKEYFTDNPRATIEGTLAIAVNKSYPNTEEKFNFIIEAYNEAHPEAPITDQEKNNIYEKFFGNVEQVENALANTMSQTIKTTNDPITEVQVNPVPIKEEIEKEELGTSGNETTVQDPVTNQNVFTYQGHKTNTSEVKLGYNSQQIEVTEDEKGYEVTSNELNEEAFPALHPENFKPGDKIKLDFNWKFFGQDNQITTYDQKEDGYVDVKVLSVKDFIESIFGKGYYPTFMEKSKTLEGQIELLKNKELLGYMPTKTTLPSGEETTLGINSDKWWNRRNVALEETPEGGKLVERQKLLIAEAKKKNNRLREQMATGNPVTITVSAREEGYHNKQVLETPEEKEQGYSSKYQSIIDAFGGNTEAAMENIGVGAMVGISPTSFTKDKQSVVKIGNKTIVLTTENSNLNEFKSASVDSNNKFNGKPFIVYQNGKTKEGHPKYIMRGIITNHESKLQSYKNQYEMIYALRQYGTAIAEDKYSSPSYKEKALKIQKFFKDNYGVNIADYKNTNDNFYSYFAQKLEIPKDRRGDYKNSEGKERSTYKVGDVITNKDKVSTVVRNPFHQPFNINNKDVSTKIPDLSGFSSVSEFESAILGNTLKSTTVAQNFMNNVHTQFIFTEITSPKHDSKWTSEVQPKIKFTDDTTIDESNKERLHKIEIDKATFKSNTKLVEQLDEQISETKDELEKKRLKKERLQLMSENGRISNSLESQGIDSKQLREESKKETVKEKEIREEKERILTEEKKNKKFDDVDLDRVSDHIMYTALNNALKLHGKSVTMQQIYETVRDTYDAYLKDLETRGKTKELNFLQKNRELLLSLQTHEGVETWSGENFDGSIIEKINVLYDTDNTTDLELGAYFIKDQNKESSEVDIVGSLSLKTKMLMAGIEFSNSRNEDNFDGLGDYMTFKDVMSFLQQGLANLPNNNLEEFKKWVEQKKMMNPEEFKFYDKIVEKLEELKTTDEAFLNEIFHFLYQPEVKMTFMMYSAQSDGTFKIQKYDANSKNPAIITENKWKENLKSSKLISLYDEDYYTIDEDHFKAVEKLHKKLVADRDSKTGKVDFNELNEYFKYFGIYLNPHTLDALDSGVIPNTAFRVYDVKEGQNATGIMASNQIFDNLFKNLISAKKFQDEGKKLIYSKSVKPGMNERVINLLTADTNNSLNILVKADNQVSAITLNSMRVAGKSINPFSMPKNITNIVTKIKNDTDFVAKLRNSSITANSFILEMFAKYPEMAEHFSVELQSLEAFKKKGTDSKDDMGPTELSDQDSLISLINLFAQSDGVVTLDEFSNAGLTLRKGSIAFPALSDSSSSPILNTILIDLQVSNFENNEMTDLADNVIDLIVDKTVINELNRVADAMKANKSTNIKGFDTGSKLINSITSLNTLLLTYQKNGVEGNDILIEVFKYHRNAEGERYIDNVQSFIKDYKQDIYRDIKNHVNQEVSDLKENFIKNDILKEKKKTEFIDGYRSDSVSYAISNIDEKYLKSKGDNLSSEKAINIIAYDYAVNNLVSLNEIQNLFAGDAANYFNDKMTKSFELGMPQVTIQDLANYYYEEALSKEELDNIQKNFSTDEVVKALVEEKYPKLLSSREIAYSDTDQRKADINPIVRLKMVEVYKEVQNNLSKRLKEQISPGMQYPNAFAKDQTYIQIMLSDVENSSEVFNDLAKNENAEEFENLKDIITEFKRLDNIYENDRTDIQIVSHQNYKNKLEEAFPNSKAFLENASTDAQEYVTWQDNLNQLRNRGKVTEIEFNAIFDKLTKQSEDIRKYKKIREENKWKPEEKDLKKKSIMQVSKPLYSGHHIQNMRGEEVDGKAHDYSVSRYIYIKSSSFPITPELSMMSVKLNNLRNNLEKSQEIDPTTRKIIKTVRASYESANKVGATKNSLPVNELYKENPNIDLINESSVILDKSNFYIQQDKPVDPESKENRTTRATQFEKILLGDGINKITDAVFPNLFDEELLNEFEVEVSDNNMLTGPQLKTIYDKIYEKEQRIKTERYNEKLGITNDNDLINGKPEVMENLVNELKKRLSNKQDLKFLELNYSVIVATTIDGKTTKRRATWSKAKLSSENQKRKDDSTLPEVTVEKAQFKMPLYMMPNSMKFESVLNAMINKSNINLKLPGFSSPVASQEGFDYKGYEGNPKNLTREQIVQNLRDNGIVTTNNYDPFKGLQATRSADGKVTSAQVFVPNKNKIFNSETGNYEYVKLEDYIDPVTNQLDTERMPEDLYNLFSFRIPTSSHQSGVVIEVVGFLPETSGSLMVVPKDHATQIGEDYDIDVRYVYQYNLIKDLDGSIRKMSSKDFVKPDKTMSELHQEFEVHRDNLWRNYYSRESKVDNNNPLAVQVSKDEVRSSSFEHNKNTIEQITRLEIELDNFDTNKKIGRILSAIFQEDFEDEYQEVTKDSITQRIIQLEDGLIPKDLVLEDKARMRLEYRGLKFFLKEAYNNEKSEYRKSWDAVENAKEQKLNEEKVIENQIVGLYKSVYTSADQRVQGLINKTLSTDNAKNTANEMKKKLDSKKNPYYSFHSATVQRGITKLGTSGKIGIGEHSNAVTQNSIFQQSDFKHFIMGAEEFIDGEKTGKRKKYNIILGNQVFTGEMGKVKTDSSVISELGMENQNSATDNQKLQIMGNRNENKNTMSVLKILHAEGIEKDGTKIRLDNGNKKEMSYASLFINQPILREYSELVDKFSSSSYEGFGNPKDKAIEYLQDKYGEESYWQMSKYGPVIPLKIDIELYNDNAPKLNSQKLYDSLLGVENKLEQLIVLQNFKDLQNAASKYNKVQKLVNVESDGMGLSYFNAIEKMADLLEMTEYSVLKEMYDQLSQEQKDDTRANPIPLEPAVSNSDKMLGDMKISSNFETDEELKAKGYVKVVTKRPGVNIKAEIYNKINVGDSVFIKPTNHYSHKIVNSISLGYNTYNSLFPYNNTNISEAIDSILENMNISKNSEKYEKEKYKVISGLKDYIYTNNSELFDGDIESSREQLFFDDKETGNVSLASYLKDLEKDPTYRDMFRKPFFRDLVFRINEGTHPSMIEFNNSDISKVNTLQIYNNFSKLMKSNRELKSYRGEKYTEKMLVKDLLKYTLLADQGNGAIGFRQHLPVELFEKYKVVKGVSHTANVNSAFQGIAFHGSIRNIEKAFMSTMDENGNIENRNPYLTDPKVINNIVTSSNSTIKELTGEDNTISYNPVTKKLNYSNHDGSIIKSDYIRQYIQHNNRNITRIDDKKMQKTAEGQNFTLEGIADGSIKEFYFNTKNKFITYEDMNGKLHLYENVADNFFREIPTLGVFGMNEYNNRQKQVQSRVEKNNPIRNVRESIAVSKSAIPGLLNKTEGEKITGTNLETVLNELSSPEYKGEFSPIFNLFRNYVNFSNVNIKVGETGKYKAKYLANGTILINPDLLVKDSFSMENLSKAIAEEMIHHVTVNGVERFVTFTGFDPSTNTMTWIPKQDENGVDMIIPSEVLSLITVYNEALKIMAKKHGTQAIVDMISKNDSHIGADTGTQNDLYRVSNIHEFIAGIFFKDEAFAKEMANTPYKTSGQTVFSKFTNVLSRLFLRIVPSLKKETISGETIASITSLMEKLVTDPKTKKVTKSPFKLAYGSQEQINEFYKTLKLIKDVTKEIVREERKMTREELLADEENDFFGNVEEENKQEEVQNKKPNINSKVSLKEIGKDNINVAVTTGSGNGHIAWKANKNNAYDQTGVKISNGPFVHTHKDGEISFHIPFNYLDPRAGSHLVVAIKGYKKENIDADEVSILLQKIAQNIKKNVPLSIAEKKVAVMKVVNDTIDEFLSKESNQGLNAPVDERFQKTPEELRNLVVSEKTIRDLTAKLSDRIGIPVRFVSDRTKQYKSKIENGVAYVNLAYATLDTPIHEILGHPIIRAIKNRRTDEGGYVEQYNNAMVEFDENNPNATREQAIEYADKKVGATPTDLYQNLLKELETGKGKEVLDRIKRDYKFESKDIQYYNNQTGLIFKNNEYVVLDMVKSVKDSKEIGRFKTQKEADEFIEKYSQDTYGVLDKQKEEAIVELLGLMTAEKLDAVKDGKLISLLKRLLKEMKAFVRDLINQKEIEIDKLPDNITVNDLANILAYSNSKLILPGNEVIYTTPDNQQFKTYAEASNHISELAKSSEDVDLSSVKLSRDQNNYIANTIEDVKKWLNSEIEFPRSFHGITYYKDENLFTTTSSNPRERKEIPDDTVVEKFNLILDSYKKRGISNPIENFIEKNKEYEQSKEIIEEWKKVNNIVYNPEEIYSRGQEFSSVVGAYSQFDVNLMMQNLLQHIEDNEKAGGKFAISAYTKPIDRQIGHLEGGGGKIKFKLYPQSQDILWASNIDVYSGSVWDASEKVNKDKKSELLGVSYTKYPSLQNVNAVQSNLASIVDDLAHHHNELGITLTGSNFRLEYDEDIPYTTKKIIDSINSILDQKYGKLVKPEISEKTNKEVIRVELSDPYETKLSDKIFTSEQEAKEWIKKESEQQDKYYEEIDQNPIYKWEYRIVKQKQGIQPTQTNETLKESIDSVSDKFRSIVSNYSKDINLKGLKVIENSNVNPFDTFPFHIVNENNEVITGISTIEKGNIWIKDAQNQKEYTSQALINTKIAVLKEVAKKQPRSLIRSEVKKIKPTSISPERYEDMWEDPTFHGEFELDFTEHEDAMFAHWEEHFEKMMDDPLETMDIESILAFKEEDPGMFDKIPTFADEAIKCK